jgi:ABC-2 type transport system ATP-binding protein
VLLVTHYMDEAERLCDRIAVINRGRVVALDNAAGLIAHAAPDDPRATLEDAFVSLTAARRMS